jgi:glycosyltransferase involved in cell wall biosynthesis
MLSKLESSSIAALEALWHGIPCVLTKGCGVDGFLHNIHGYLLKDRSGKELASVISRLLSNDRPLLDLWRLNLFHYRESFSWNSYILSLDEILKRHYMLK